MNSLSNSRSTERTWVILRNDGPECYIITTLSAAVNFCQTEWLTNSSLKLMQGHWRNTTHKNCIDTVKQALTSSECGMCLDKSHMTIRQQK